jgi:hypothetical protein
MKNRSQASKQIRTIKKTTLVISLLVGLTFSLVMGFTGGAMGIGSLYPQMNLIAKPFVCSGGQMSYSQQASRIGTATYWTAKWYCVDEQSGAKTEIDPDAIFLYAGAVYGFVFFAFLLLITYFYWNSSIGPAKNGGPRLW